MSEITPMFDPPHPGEFIRETYLAPLGISAREFAHHLGVSPSTMIRVLSGASRLTPQMAVRLAKALGSTPRFWLTLQTNRDVWEARDLDVSGITRIDTAA